VESDTHSQRGIAMPKLNQVNALVTGRREAPKKAVTELYHIAQKPELFNGRVRTYKPDDDVNGERLPPEAQNVQWTAQRPIEQAVAAWQDWWDLTATQDVGNQSARADIVIDGRAVLKDVPVTTLLFLEKQVEDLATFIGKLPTPDASERWTWDAN